MYTKSNLYLENLTKTYNDLHYFSTIVSIIGFVLPYIVSTDIWIDPFVWVVNITK